MPIFLHDSISTPLLHGFYADNIPAMLESSPFLDVIGALSSASSTCDSFISEVFVTATKVQR